MSLAELYDELGVSQNLEEQDEFFNELIQAAESSNLSLGSKKSKKKRQSLIDEIKLRQTELKSCTAEFSRFLEVYPLSEDDFRSQGVLVPPNIASQMKKYQFALLNIPIMLVPVKGWGFTTLDCIVTFNPDRPLDQHPIAHQLFPSEQWVEKIKFSQHLSIGVDEFLNFKLTGGIPSVAVDGLDTDVEGGFHLVCGPYNYSVQLPRVIARGCGNDKVRWTLEGEENIQKLDLKLGVVLKVPRKAKKVEVIGVMTLSRNFHTFTADVKYLVEYIRSRSKNFFEQGTPSRLPPGIWDITEQLKEG